MAALTWRNVDAPSFSGPNEMWKLAATLMNQGFDRARQGIDDFRTTTTEEQSAAMMQKIIAAGDDPAAIQAAAASGNSAFLSPAALDFANKQQGVLLDRQATRANIERTGVLNQATRQGMDIAGFQFENAKVDRQRADADYALVPEATAAMTNLRSQMAAGTLSGDAATTAQQEFLTKYGRALGIKDASQVGAFFTNNQTAFTTQQGDDLLRMKNFNELDGLIRSKDARGIAANVLTQYGDVETATRAIQGFGNIDKETAALAIKELGTLAPAVAPRTAAQTEALTNPLLANPNQPRISLPSNYQPVIMNNNGTRNLPLNENLNAALNSVLPSLGLTAVVTSGGQVTAEEAARGLGGRTGSTRHDHGGAADVKFRTTDGRILSWENPQDVPLLQSAVTELKKAGLTGFGAGSDYMGATTTHIGYGTPAVWGAKGSAPYQALLDAYNGATTTATTNTGPTVERAAATEAAPQYQAAMDAVANGQNYTAPIDINRPQIQNDDGTVSTEKTFTTEIGGAWFNIPSIVNGKELPEQEALDQFKKGTNPAVGVFQNQREAEAAAEARTNQIDQALAAAATTTSAAQTQATAEQNNQLTAAVTPTVEQTTTASTSQTPQTVTVNDNFPRVDPNATGYVQDQQKRARTTAINNAIAELTSNTGGGFGSGVSDWVGGTWDYYTTSPENAAANAQTRQANNAAGDFLATNADYFRQNPSEIAVARRDPVAYVQSFGQTDSQKAWLASQNKQVQAPATTEGQPNTAAVPTIVENKPATTTSGNQQQQTPQDRLRTQLTNAETLSQLFSTANNTAALNQANQQYQSIIDAVQNEEQSGKDAASLATELVGKDGALGEKYNHGSITQAIQNIRRELGVSPAIAAALLKETGDYSDGFLGFFDGYSNSMQKARDLWTTYQNASNADGGVSILNASDMTKYQRAQVKALQDQATAAEAALKTTIADRFADPTQVALAQQQLAQLPSLVRERLMFIYDQGALDNNIRARTPK